MKSLTTRIFKNGNSQTVRIPQEFRVDASQVQISSSTDTDLVIHPITQDLSNALIMTLNAFDEDFANCLEADYSQQLTVQAQESADIAI
jgi:antitoxin VapB